jgi:O-antigen ligase
MRVNKIEQNKTFNIIIIFSSLIFLAFTPWVNKDSIVVPKIILLFSLALYLLPKILKEYRRIYGNRTLRFLLLLVSLIIIQMLLVISMSEAPIEQQVFGKMGRGLGFITAFSILIITLAVALLITPRGLSFFLKTAVFSFSISSIYSILQSYGLDFIKWETKTNAIFGTLGNPNFQSSAAAMIVIPCILLFSKRTKFFILTVILAILNFLVIIKTQSVQGLVGFALGLAMLMLIIFWYKNKYLFVTSTIVFFISAVTLILAMVNQGPLRGFSAGPLIFYKSSVQSRGDFWRSALAASKDHPIFGVGIDSFGDYFLKYRDIVAANHPFAEFTDNAHNYFLEYVVTGGYPLLFLHILLTFLTFRAFVKMIKSSSNFNRDVTSLFVFWMVFQAQSFVSPGSIGLMVFNAIATGAIIGLSQFEVTQNSGKVINSKGSAKLISNSSTVLVLIGLVISYPYFNTDRLYLKALNSQDAILLVESTKRYPQSTSRYSTASRLLLESKVYEQSLKVALSAIEFNPNSISPWAHVFLNPISSLEYKQKAKQEMIKLDPNNKSLTDIEISQ